MTLEQIEAALDGHKLYTAVSNSRWWLCRRNGATKRWKRDPERYRIPVKAGFRGHAAIEPHSLWAFCVADSREQAESGHALLCNGMGDNRFSVL